MARHDEAIGALERTVALSKAFPFALRKLVDFRRKRADWRSFEREQAGLDEAVESGVAIDPFAFLHASSSPALQLTCAKTFVVCRHGRPGARCGETQNAVTDFKAAHRYMSADFRNHAIGHLMAGVIEEHDRERFEVSAISYGPDDRSELRDRLKAAFERFEDVSHLPDEDVVKLIRQLGIEILGDLGGFTARTRPKNPCAPGGAPIQVNYLGYLGTMDASYIDYIMADRIVIPEAEQKH